MDEKRLSKKEMQDLIDKNIEKIKEKTEEAILKRQMMFVNQKNKKPR